jgi:hypothetical protein
VVDTRLEKAARRLKVGRLHFPCRSRRSPRHPRLVEAYAHCADRREATGQMALFTTGMVEGPVFENRDIRAMVESPASPP